MNYTRKYTDILKGVFCNCDNSGIYNITINTNTRLDNHNVFNKMFVVNICSNSIEIPIFARYYVEKTLLYNNENPLSQYNKIVIPLYVNAPVLYKRNIDCAVRDLFSRVCFNNRLQKVITSKDEIYYGAKGIILDKDFNILLLCTIFNIVDEFNAKHTECRIYINPRVFLDEKESMYKTIIRKIIPFYISHDVRLHSYAYRETYKPRIIIDDVSSFIETPANPSIQECLEDTFSQFLIDNLDSILDQFQ